MNDKLAISLVVAGIKLSMTINPEEEQVFRDAAKMINSRITDYIGRYAKADPAMLLALTALELAMRLQRANERNDVEPVLKEIEGVSRRLDAYVKE